jgi:hypothetical protein
MIQGLIPGSGKRFFSPLLQNVQTDTAAHLAPYSIGEVSRA